ncbi:MAG TPA: hypothetical protein PLW48_03785 [Alphaproteobacteria bacterium]|nr:hypothetical protein [Rhodospirillaceae bacterium]HRJ66233.1 hypothetical protein [Alphaproteobacteria bacterium]
MGYYNKFAPLLITEEKPAVLQFLGAHGDQGGGSPWTFAGKTLGAAAADRRIMVTVFAPSTSTNAGDVITGVTVAGVTAARMGIGISSTGFHNIAVYMAHVPTGTSGDIVVTTSGGRASMSVAWYRVTGLKTFTPYDTKVDNTTSAVTLSVSINALKGGFVLVGAMKQGQTGGVTWTLTGASEDQDSPFPIDPSTGAAMVAGSVSITTSGARAITASPDGSINATETLLAISMR